MSSDDEDPEFAAQLLSAIEESKEEEKNRKLRKMTNSFPTLPYDVIHKNLHLTDEEMVLILSQLVENQRLEEEKTQQAQKVFTDGAAKPIDQALFSENIDMAKFYKEQVAEALWAELVRRQGFLDVTNVTRSTSEQTKISLFLRDHFTMVKMSAISRMVQDRDFYQCILIMALCGYEGFEERLRGRSCK
ncbi:unnamed protein product, partial [Mesorhabditis belari]|uniref:Uncharacterized protein n=1 Tax=Mesorhabditis belari TaxID=2138241 RepID=A0AAF3EEV2_9BILA